ncbi:hypothetical protein [Intrasporangium sp. DVR]|uniref:hypothetical protein n=1 Tax=Intrasporangium sp. DVR TaxID=3127867 RepID=UPI00313A4FAE
MLSRPVRVPRPSLRGPAVWLVGAVLLTGCSADARTPAEAASGSARSQASTTARATGSASSSGSTATSTGPVDAADAIAGRAGTYTVLPPDGWGEATDEVGAVSGIDLVLMSSRPVDGFNTNLVVHVAEGDAASLEAELERGREELADQGRAVSGAPDITVAGVPATGFTTSVTQQGIEVVARSYGLHRGGRVYVLTVSAATSATAQADADFTEILESWTWT